MKRSVLGRCSSLALTLLPPRAPLPTQKVHRQEDGLSTGAVLQPGRKRRVVQGPAASGGPEVDRGSGEPLTLVVRQLRKVDPCPKGSQRHPHSSAGTYR